MANQATEDDNQCLTPRAARPDWLGLANPVVDDVEISARNGARISIRALDFVRQKDRQTN